MTRSSSEKLTAIRSPERSISSHRCVVVEVHRRSGRTGGRSVRPGPGAARPGPGTAAASRRVRRRRGSRQSSLESRNVDSACGSGTRSGSQPIRANSSSRPLRVASPSSSSGCEVKNAHGVDAAHSSPMNSIGVNGPVSTSTAAMARSSADSVRGEPVADGPVADLVVVLRVPDEPPARGDQRVHRAGRDRGRGSWRTCRRGRTPRSAPWRWPTSGRNRRSSLRFHRSGRRAGRGGSRRSTARSARSRRPPAG